MSHTGIKFTHDRLSLKSGNRVGVVMNANDGSPKREGQTDGQTDRLSPLGEEICILVRSRPAAARQVLAEPFLSSPFLSFPSPSPPFSTQPALRPAGPLAWPDRAKSQPASPWKRASARPIMKGAKFEEVCFRAIFHSFGKPSLHHQPSPTR